MEKIKKRYEKKCACTHTLKTNLSKGISGFVFLDHAATTPTAPEVVKAMQPFWNETFGNASGLHFFSWEAKQALGKARKTVAEILNCEIDEIIFTGSGTESDNLAIFGSIEANQTKEKNHLLTSKIEHHAVLRPFEKLERNGHAVTFLNPTKQGEITPEIFKKGLKKSTLLASIMWAQNEIGTINDISKLAALAHKNGTLFHTDACQIGGSEELNVKKLGIDFLTLNGSKIYGPKGVGILYKKRGVKIAPQILGGGQEQNFRSGTENIALIVGFAEALKLVQKNRKQESLRLERLRDKLIQTVLKKIPLARLNGDAKKRLPGNAHFSFLNTEGESLVLMLDALGFATATGSACSTADLEPSHVLTGIGMPHEIAHGSLRVTMGKSTTEKNIDNFCVALEQVVMKIRAMSPVNFTKKDFPEWF